MKIICTSDLHGQLPRIPVCDLLLIAGDICPVSNHEVAYQREWLCTTFRYWLAKIKAKKIIFIAGNHDFVFQDAPHQLPIYWTQKNNTSYLQDSSAVVDGLKIWGTPWQLPFYDWAFNACEASLAEKYRAIPGDTNIIVSHGPPYGHTDWSNYGNQHTGSTSLLKTIQQIQPLLVVTGHIHEAVGFAHINKTLAVNCAAVDEKYILRPQPLAQIEVKDNKVISYGFTG